MSEVAGFLLARIAEDEASAQRALEAWPSRRWKAEACTAYGWRNGRLGNEPELPFVVTDDGHGALMLASIWPEDGTSITAHVARFDPARVFAECKARREVIERILGFDMSDSYGLLEVMAETYADHPDYREEWRP